MKVNIVINLLFGFQFKHHVQSFHCGPSAFSVLGNEVSLMQQNNLQPQSFTVYSEQICFMNAEED